ncbi:MAG: APC family permease [Acidimicrobiales bacterium]|nr:MAG: APC family permease [Acidimicrobiales bacterium]
MTEMSTSRYLRRDVGLVGLLFTSLGSVIGSGWLFGALTASSIAGPAAMLSWLLGGAAVTILALAHAEVGAMFPVAGASARIPHFAFGSLAGFCAGWFAFLGCVTTAPIEVEAALQYATHYIPGLTVEHAHQIVLTGLGYAVAALMMLFFSAINVLGVRWLSKTNIVTMWWKIAIPVVTVIALVFVSFHSGNFTAGGGFMPAGMKGVFSAIATGGVIFGFIGFEQAIQLGAESRNPRRNIPLAVIGSVLIGVVLYLALQFAFIAALDPASLQHGWSALSSSGNTKQFGPFAALATGLGLGWLAFALYTDAFISPTGTGLLYVATSSRLSYAMGRQRYIPAIFGRLNLRGAPVYAIAFSFLCGMIVFLPFPGWQQLVGFVSSATVIAYAMIPLALGALRKTAPDQPRPYRLPCSSVLAPLAFIVANEIILFSAWVVVWKLLVAIAIGFVLLGIALATTPTAQRPKLAWRPVAWMWPYLIGLGLVSYLSSFNIQDTDRIPLLGVEGPTGTLGFGWDIAVMAAFSLGIYYLALQLRLPVLADQTDEHELQEEELERLPV